jgi:nucleoid-associated protein EbfC
MRNPFQSMIQSQIAGFQTQIVLAMEQLAEMQIEGSSGGGAIRVFMTGTGEVVRVEVEPAVLQEQDTELVADLIAAAMRDALRAVAEAKHEKIMGATPLAALGMDLPNIF